MVRENSGPKINQEKHTVSCMITLYCHKQHHTIKGLCEECQDLHDYAMARLTLCRFGEEKPTCERCIKHCYRRNYQQKIKQVMRYSGPRMLFYHPIMAINHLIKNIKSRHN